MPRSRVSRRRVANKSTGGILPKIPAPVDPVGNAPNYLTKNTVAYPSSARAVSVSCLWTASLGAVVAAR